MLSCHPVAVRPDVRVLLDAVVVPPAIRRPRSLLRARGARVACPPACGDSRGPRNRLATGPRPPPASRCCGSYPQAAARRPAPDGSPGRRLTGTPAMAPPAGVWPAHRPWLPRPAS